MASGKSIILGASARLLIFELVIVFVGVYGAFWVENYRDRKEQEEKAMQLADALRQDVQDHINVVRYFIRSVDEGFAQFEEARSRGETPPPYFFRIPGSEVPPTATWEAVRQAEAATLLDSGLLFDLGFYYNEITGSAHRFIRYSEFTEAEVLPRLKPGGAGFYSADGTHLLPRFATHMDLLREYRDFLVSSMDMSTCLIERLEAPRQRGQSCRPQAPLN